MLVGLRIPVCIRFYHLEFRTLTFSLKERLLVPSDHRLPDLVLQHLHRSVKDTNSKQTYKNNKMGIQGLLPFLKKASKNTHAKHYKGQTAAVDGLGWLHKGAFGCAVKLGMGEDTNAYVVYCMKYVNVLLANGIKPVIVFDGRSLPSKEITNKKRREIRKENRKKAQDCVRRGEMKGSWEYFVKSIEITHQMIHKFIEALRELHIDYIVAPYEADAQMAYLARNGFVDLVITEDSDLTLFGCPRILFKLKMDGSCVLFEQSKIYLCMDTPAAKFQFERFRQMSILSGCDYLESLPGIGLGKAKKVINSMISPDIKQAIQSIPSTLNMSIEIPDDYIEEFIKAENTFLYQLVFDPLKRKVVPLNPYLINVDPEQMPYAGAYDLKDDEYFAMALGSIDTKTLKEVDKFILNKGYTDNVKSIWSKCKQSAISISTPKNCIKSLKKGTTPSSTKGLTASVSLKNLGMRKRPLDVDEDKMDNPTVDVIDTELLALYVEEGQGQDQDETSVQQKLIKYEENEEDQNDLQSKSKRMKRTVSVEPMSAGWSSTSLSLRSSDTYGMRTTRNSINSSAPTTADVNSESVEKPSGKLRRASISDPEEEFSEIAKSPRKSLKKRENPFAKGKSPDIGLRARAKITGILKSLSPPSPLKSPMKDSNFSHLLENQQPNVYVDLERFDDDQDQENKIKKDDDQQPICLVEKNFVYDCDDKLIVKSQYFRPQKAEVEEKIRSESIVRSGSNDHEDVNTDSEKLTASQLSIYSIDKDSFANSQSQNINKFLDLESQNLKAEFLMTEDTEPVTLRSSRRRGSNAEVVVLSDEDDGGTQSSYFNDHIQNSKQNQKGAGGILNHTALFKTAPSSSSSASSRSSPRTSAQNNKSGNKAAVKSPRSKVGGTKLNGTCRQHGLKKAPTKSKTNSGQMSILEMFSYKQKAKI